MTGAISAIDMALHDLVGKALGVPVYVLLGGKQRDLVPCFCTVHNKDSEVLRGRKLREDELSDMVIEAKAQADAGFQCIRIGPSPPDKDGHYEPREAIAATAKICTDIRAAIGDTVVLGLEWHHRLSVAEAASFCHKIAPDCLDWVEEIIRDETPESYEQVPQSRNPAHKPPLVMRDN